MKTREKLAWISVLRIGVAAMACALLILAAFTVQRALSRQGASPLPMDTPAAASVLPLILIADLDDRVKDPYSDPDPTEQIYQGLLAQVQRDGLPVRVERLNAVVDEYTVEPIASSYAAALVIWGWYDNMHVVPLIEQVATPVTRSDPSTIAFCTLDDLPTQAIHLTSFTLSVYAYGQGLYERALEHLSQDPGAGDLECGAVANQRGLIHRAKSEYVSALTEFSRALELEPDNARYYANRGDTFTRMGEHNAALADYSRALELSQDVLDLFR